MTSSAPTRDLAPLGSRQREEAGQQLQAALVDLLDLSLLGKQLHWTVTGPLFRPLHLQLDELVDTWRELADTVAERALAIGVVPDGQSATIARDTSMPGVQRGEIDGAVAVRELTIRLAEAAARMRQRMDCLGPLDPASQDAVIEVVRALEQQLWMVRAQFVDEPRR